MAKEIFKNLPDKSTPLSASKLNGLFDGAESMGSIVVEDVTCKNLFNPSKVLSKGNLSVSGDKISSTGIAGDIWSYEKAQYYDTLQAGTYTLSVIFSTQETSQYGAIFIVNSGGNWITTSQYSLQNLDKKVFNFTLTKETEIGIQLKLSNGVCKIQIEKGSVATDYVEYKHFTNKETYSRNEQVIGTWLGKPLYRKVVEYGTLPNTTSKLISHHIANIDIYANIRGFAYQTNTNDPYTMPLPFVSSTLANNVNMSCNRTAISITTGSDRSGWYAFVILEYTKTTD